MSSCIQIRIPICKINQSLIELRSRVIEFRKKAATTEIMVILVDFPECVTDQEMILVVIKPMALRAIYRHSTIWTRKVDMRETLVGVRGVGTVCVCFDVGGTLAHGNGRGLVHGMEEVSGLEQDPGVLEEWVMS